MSRLRWFTFLCWCCALLAPSLGLALDNGSAWFDWRYRLEDSGARGHGMGGTAVALTGDAGASLVNPAALTDVEKPELMLEGRGIRLEEHSTAGSTDGTGNPLQAGLHAEKSRQLQFGHAGLALPLKGTRAVLGLFYHRLAQYNRTIRASDPRDGSTILHNEPLFAVDEFGAALASEFLSGRLALGLAGSLATLNLDNKVTAGDSSLLPGAGGRELLFYGQVEQEPVWRIGLVWKPTSAWRIGLTQHLLPTVDYKLATSSSFGLTADPALSRCTPTGFSSGWVCESTLPIPNVLALGAAYQVHPRLTLAAELRSVKYSQLTHKFNGIFVTPGASPPAAVQPGDFEAEDVVEVHLGVEWQGQLDRRPLMLRAGYWLDPAHGIRYRGSDATTAAIFDGGEEVHHGTLGLGLPLGASHQFDFALDLASDGRHRGWLSWRWRL